MKEVGIAAHADIMQLINRRKKGGKLWLAWIYKGWPSYASYRQAEKNTEQIYSKQDTAGAYMR